MPSDEAEKIYNSILSEFKKSGLKIEAGIFGAKMDVKLINDGPVTIMLDNDEI